MESAILGVVLFFGCLIGGRKIVGGIARQSDILAVLLGIIVATIAFTATH